MLSSVQSQQETNVSRHIKAGGSAGLCSAGYKDLGWPCNLPRLNVFRATVALENLRRKKKKKRRLKACTGLCFDGPSKLPSPLCPLPPAFPPPSDNKHHIFFNRRPSSLPSATSYSNNHISLPIIKLLIIKTDIKLSWFLWSTS